MSFSLMPGGDRAPQEWDEGWNALVSRALDLDDVGEALGEVIAVFGGLGFAEHLTDPSNAHDQCVTVSETFASMCTHRAIPAETVLGFLQARVPPLKEPAVVCGHAAVHALAACAPERADSAFIIDWTPRQFDPGAPVPLIVTPSDWRRFWRALSEDSDGTADAVPGGRPEHAGSGIVARV